ncbi:MAG: sugar transferase [Sphingomonas sp.]|nr:sugar transferase [Sphingomonas sp.]
MSLYKSYGKRMLDLAAAGIAILFLFPLLLLTAALIAARLGRPVLFVQRRSGLHGRPFNMIKFRSMLDAVDAGGQPLPDADRLTPFGLWLRSSSLDELPGLWNIITGDMSLVGPRPLHTHYDSLYSPRQKKRLEVRPGVTGLAQVNGRNALSWPAKFELDVQYVETQTFLLDMRILFATIPGVLKRQGINAVDAATMPAFKGETGAETESLRRDR